MEAEREDGRAESCVNKYDIRLNSIYNSASAFKLQLLTYILHVERGIYFLYILNSQKCFFCGKSLQLLINLNIYFLENKEI